MRKIIKKILKEEFNPQDLNDNVLSFLRRRYKMEDVIIGDIDNDPMVIKKVVFNVDGVFYVLNSFKNKRQNINTVITMLDESGVIDYDWGEKSYDKDRQILIRTIKLFLKQINFQ
jgi:hypothetical protein